MTPTTETWRPVVGYEGLYEVSDQGRVRSLNRIVQTSAGPRRYRGRVLTPNMEKRDGRPQVHLSRVGHITTHRVQALVLSAFVGPRPDGMYSLHNDGNPANNKVENLRWGTPSDNNADALRHGTQWQIRKTHCKRGHALQAPNLVPSALASGARSCLACSRAQANAKHARSRGRSIDETAAAHAHYQRICASEPPE